MSEQRNDEENMPGMTPKTVARAVGGVYTGPEELKDQLFSDITTDSRTVQAGALFVAIQGQRVDGNQFIPGSYEQGALCCMSTLPPQDTSKPYIQVASCEQALKDMAEYYRSSLDVKVVGITGSVGKTTTKEMIASVLSRKYDTLKTRGNFNNEIGLPLTVFRLRSHHQVAVLEMGISDFGEMSRLGRIARPDVCVITNIGQCHLENLGTRQGVLQAKTEVFDYVERNGTVILNGDDDQLITCVQDERINPPVYYGLYPEARSFTGEVLTEGVGADRQLSVYPKSIQRRGLLGSKVEIATPEGQIDVMVPSPGMHMVSNALAAAAVGLTLGLTPEQIREGIEAYEPVDGHGHIMEIGSLTVMDDCYNANPVSVRAAIDVLAEADGRRVAILGDMYELGTDEKQLHYEIGEYLVQKGIDVLLAVGGLGREYAAGAEAQKRRMEGQKHALRQTEIVSYDTPEQVIDELKQRIKPSDAVLVKASHAMHFEKIVAKLGEVC